MVRREAFAGRGKKKMGEYEDSKEKKGGKGKHAIDRGGVR